ncbi:hypothetical protein HWV62_3653 [Athelia sp. TMB]|nr:hypothetical protein HWV62_3653 [Athelia sp. TMB]
MARVRALHVLLSILGLFLFGTVVVLSSVSYYLAIDQAAYLSDLEVPTLDNVTRWNATEHGQVERIPRIIHQTWKSETLPERWTGISKACRDMMPDYEYMLWTDASSREFIAKHYAWFLTTFDEYTYPIQRADAIRYFVLHYYGGVYLDLDVGCLRPLDPLLIFPVILPKTIPVGVSNDLMFAEKGHPFLTQTIHKLIAFDYSWVINYPTVMFSTGPMFLSAQYGLWTASHPPTAEMPGGEVRILPKSLYGKNAKPEEAPHSFFAHYYGSSWHADDAAFIGFLGKWGKGLMWVGFGILILAAIRMVLQSRQRKYSLRRIGGYDVMLPRWSQRGGRWHIDLGWLSLPAGLSTQPSSPSARSPPDAEGLLPFDGPPSPSASDVSASEDTFINGHGSSAHPVFDAVRSLRSRFASFTGTEGPVEEPRTPFRPRRQQSRGVLFFLPAFFTQSEDVELSAYNSVPHIHPPPPPIQRTTSAPFPPEKRDLDDVLGRGESSRSRTPDCAPSQNYQAPHRPPYGARSSSSPAIGSLVDAGSSSRT